MATPSCNAISTLITSINRTGGNDLTVQFAMKIKPAAAPDASYVDVTTTKDIAGITMPTPVFDDMEPGDYTIHVYPVSDPSQGTKVTFTVYCEDPI